MDDLSVNIRLRFAYLDTSWEDLAEKAGETPRNVRSWVQSSNPSNKTLERLARVLGVPLHELMNPEFDPRKYPAP